MAAAPWRLRAAVWSGGFDEAAAALGEDAQRWGRFEPSRVWLAVYERGDDPETRLTLRVFAFESAERAEQAYGRNRPDAAGSFAVGDEGCWLPDGVLFRWSRLVFESFVYEPAGHETAESVVPFVGYIERRMPAGLPGDPR
jgi:hypothetical protein